MPSRLTSALIESRGRAALRGLQRNFGIAEPRLAVSGLNPHAGEGGQLGREEIEIIEPAIAALAAEGWRVTGPHPADTMFHARARANYDAALCMYHDQALIPIKALHFEEAVNVTLGLPIVRTAPDHGTAFDIAGQDRADPRPMAAAIRMAAESAACAPTRRLSALARAAARRHRAPRAQRQQGARPEFHPRPAVAGADRGNSRACSKAQRFMKSGPGPGGLTRALLDAGASVVAVERDRRCIPALAELAAGVRRAARDHRRRRAARSTSATLVGEGAHVVANLPYNVGTALAAANGSAATGRHGGGR